MYATKDTMHKVTFDSQDVPYVLRTSTLSAPYLHNCMFIRIRHPRNSTQHNMHPSQQCCIHSKLSIKVIQFHNKFESSESKKIIVLHPGTDYDCVVCGHGYY